MDPLETFDVTLLCYFDNPSLSGSIEDLERGYKLLKAEAATIGLHLNPTKCRCISHGLNKPKSKALANEGVVIVPHNS